MWWFSCTLYKAFVLATHKFFFISLYVYVKKNRLHFSFLFYLFYSVAVSVFHLGAFKFCYIISDSRFSFLGLPWA